MKTRCSNKNIPLYNDILCSLENLEYLSIFIYENELITKKSSDGNIYTMTQGDWDCYENFLKNK